MLDIRQWRAWLLLAAAPLTSNLYAAQCEFRIVNEWNSGFTAAVKITNDTGQDIDGWSVSLEYSDGSSINNMWNANLSGNNPYQASNKNYNRNIRNNRSVEFGFNGRKSSNNAPAQTPILGDICATGNDSNQRPLAQATASDLIGTIPLEVDFDASESSDPEGQPLSYRWDFDDGSASDQVSPTHIFTEVGTYTVSLVVNDGDMDSQITTLTVVAEAPQPEDALCEFRISNEWNSGFTSYVKISNDADYPINGWTVSLSFADGSRVSGAWNASVTGDNPYQFTHANYNANIAAGSHVEFGFNSQKAVPNTSAPTPELGGICRAQDMANSQPVALANVSPQRGAVPLTVTFDASGSTDADEDALTYLWAFADGSTSTEISFERTFENADTYDVSLTVNDGTVDSAPVVVSIVAEEFVNTPPVASANVTPQQGIVPLTVTFDASGSTDVDEDALTYLWAFADGSTSTEISFERTFENADTYDVSLTVNDGTVDSAPVVVSIVAEEFVNTPPVASANVTPQQGNAPLTVTFDASGSTDADSDALSYLWEFEDGSTSTDVKLEKTFTESGDYSASLTVNDGTANSETSITTITVSEALPGQAYSLDTSNSSLHFVSTKKAHVLETHTFTDISGDISSLGVATLNINLASVETGIDIRNQRMRDHLFEVTSFGTAEVNLSVDLAIVADMAAGSSQVQTVSPTLSLHGVDAVLETSVRITKLSDTHFMVQNVNPMIIQAADFDLTGGIEVLRDLAGLSVISYSVPTNFTLVFSAQQ